MEVIKNFLNDYGYSFLMMIIEAFVIALLLELTVKKALAWLATKWADKPRLIAMLDGAKIFLIQLVTWTLVVWFLDILMECMPMPGSKVFFPVWLGLLYILQYIFSVFGIKGFMEWVKELANREPKQKDDKPVLEKTSVKGVYKNEKGAIVDKHGRPIEF